MRDDADEISDRLAADIKAVLNKLKPGWREVRGRGYLTPKEKDLGSFQVHISGAKQGQWYRHSRKIGGGVIKLVAYLLSGNESPSKEDFKDAFQWARRHLGMTQEAETEEASQRRQEAARRHQADRERAQRRDEAVRRRKAETAQEVWAQCLPIAGTLAEKYLNLRGIPTPPCGWPDVLGFHDRLEWELGSVWEDKRKVQDGPYFPCLVGRVQDAVGDTVAVWRVFLDPLTGGKAPVDNPKVGMGPAGGGAVRIGGLGPEIGGGEGMESSLAAWTIEGYRFPIWATLSTSGMIGFEPPMEVKRIRIYPDGDLPQEQNGMIRAPPGLEAARKLRDRMILAGVPTGIEEPPFNADFLDVLNSLTKKEDSHGQA
ncbi:DUF7146 domain-containing protein [Azorhizobium doebereinerae]|uniref:DUF7146 domain-containing protein n=1 Tax=Azorhizobium doebereinerae TaxID=281091 RepID=UPI000416935B|nr:hypothetical protein [Azorhizobium doebereinerae]